MTDLKTGDIISAHRALCYPTSSLTHGISYLVFAPIITTTFGEVWPYVIIDNTGNTFFIQEFEVSMVKRG